jgi:hypothetical protein
MFSVDYRFGSMAEAARIPGAAPVTGTNKERIAHGNAEQLFGVSQLYAWRQCDRFDSALRL